VVFREALPQPAGTGRISELVIETGAPCG
jgi:hypothetical protein